MQQAEAEVVALQALGWIAQEDSLLDIFLSVTGMGLGEVRTRATEPEFLAAVLDFVLLADDHVLALSGAHGWPPETVSQARAALPGGELRSWT